MRALPLLICVLLLPAPAAAQEHPEEEHYYVKASVHPAQAPAARDERYDCTGPQGPRDAPNALKHNTEEISDGNTGWGTPHIGPECLAFDTRPGESSSANVACTAEAPLCTGARGGSLASVATATERHGPYARGSYDLATGRYYVEYDPSFFGRMPVGPQNLTGNTGLGIRFDCRECDPPW